MHMKQIIPLLTALLLPLSAQEENTKEAIIESLMQADNVAQLNSAIAAAKKANLPQQMIVEARFMYHINQDDLASLAALSPALAKELPTYSPDNTLIFGTKEDYESVVYYTKALGALEKKDIPLFKKHITEAFWLSPAHGAQFAPHIEEIRLQQAMAKTTLDLTRELTDQKNLTTKTTLAKLTGDSPAILLHFWSPWVDGSMFFIPEYAKISKHLIENKIPTASILLAGNSEARKNASDFLQETKDPTPGSWLIDHEKKSLATTLRIARFPSTVLVKKDGSILFNGDPGNPDLWEKLANLNSNIKQPPLPIVPENITRESDTEK